ncbi:MAG: pseudouridylate synthase family protein [Rickettsiaceae bacterium]|jgi:23S rRNA pseudouridine2605 synthase|nr:pseudouridylate synthase family protein [Rickettsiaceae bacterium]
MEKEIKGQRIAKVIARSGICSRREAEQLIAEGRVKVNGEVIDTPATIITDHSIKIDDKLLAAKQPPRVWVFHKPRGLITTNKDPKARKNIFEILPKNLPRVVTVGRLDINTEGLLLLTNDGEIARYVELPSSKWTRVYRARVFGKIDMERLKKIQKGITIDGVRYGGIKVEMEQERDFNSWLKISLTEGKNREIKKVLEFFGLQVSRLIRISFGPFHLGGLPVGEVKEVYKSVLSEALPRELL